MKVMVTGGAGFIGSHLVRALVARGDSVIIIDNLSTGRLFCKDTPLVQYDIADKSFSRHDFGDIEVIFHLAAIPNIAYSVLHPEEVIRANALGTLNVLKYATSCKVKKVVYASSCAVYGNVGGLPKNEDMPLFPSSPYAASKLAGEAYCWAFMNTYGLRTVMLRYFNVYGVGQNADSEYSAVIPKFIKGVNDGTRPVVYGDGSQQRDFVYIDDAIQATLLAADSDMVGVFNVASGEKRSISELLRILRLVSANDFKVKYTKPRKGDVKDSWADISKIMRMGYNPQYDLQYGLRAILEGKTSEGGK